MDLNLDNYSVDELLNILQIPPNINITINFLQKSLYDKIDQIKNINEEDIPINKANLIEFYTKGLFKLVNNIAVINKNISKNHNIQNHNIQTQLQEQLQEQTLDQSLDQSLDKKNFITKHIDQSVINTFNSNLKSGIINPLVRKSLKQILNINTRYRDNYSTTQSTNFSINLPSSIKKVVSMKLVSCEIPFTVYTISKKLGSNSFIIDNSLIELDSGCYTPETIRDEINKQLINNEKQINLDFNKITGVMTFNSDSHTFKLDFNVNNNTCPQQSLNIYKNQLTLGWLLGFRGSSAYGSRVKQVNTLNSLYTVKESTPITAYNNLRSYKAESLYNMQSNMYFLLSINDYQNNHNDIFISPFNNNDLADNNIIAKIPSDCGCSKSYMSYPERIYFGPTDIAKLHIKLYDEYGRIVDINNTDFSFSIELEVIYDL